jgi:hypothetical protein
MPSSEELSGELWKAFMPVFEAAGVFPAVSISGHRRADPPHLANVRIQRWQNGEMTLFGLFREAGPPAAALVNLTQNAIVTFPVLASKYGVGKAMTMLSKSMTDYLRASFSKDSMAKLRDEFKGKEDGRDVSLGHMLDELERSGAVDRTMVMSLFGMEVGFMQTAINLIAVPGAESVVATPLKGRIAIEGRLFKYPFLAAEILCSDVWSIADAFFQHDSLLLVQLFRFLSQPSPLEPMTTAYCARVAASPRARTTTPEMEKAMAEAQSAASRAAAAARLRGR